MCLERDRSARRAGAVCADGGLAAAAQDSVTVRVPYAFGMLCGGTGVTTASLLPADSLTYATALPDSVAIRTGSGAYVMHRVMSVSAAPDPAEAAVLPPGSSAARKLLVDLGEELRAILTLLENG